MALFGEFLHPKLIIGGTLKIQIENIGKRYNSEWIFRGVNLGFSSGNSYAILGANGSGKSTLLQVIAGNISPSEGKIQYQLNSQPLNVERIFEHLSFASPYLELPEEMTLVEMIKFHFSFKKAFQLSENIIEILELEGSKSKQIKYFSSGMKQRVRLGLAILSNTPILLLDEPSTNLDQKGIEWYRKLINNFTKERLVIVCSNHQEREFDFCGEKFLMENYKVPSGKTRF